MGGCLISKCFQYFCIMFGPINSPAIYNWKHKHIKRKHPNPIHIDEALRKQNKSGTLPHQTCERMAERKRSAVSLLFTCSLKVKKSFFIVLGFNSSMTLNYWTIFTLTSTNIFTLYV